MNKISLILNAILGIAIIVLFVMMSNLKKDCPTTSEPSKPNTFSNNHIAPIAYINIDSLLMTYEFSKQANEELIKKQEDSRLTLNVKARSLQNEMSEFQRKLENNAFLSRERAEQEQKRILKKQEDLQELEQKLTEELMIQQQKVSEQLRDTMDTFLKHYNKDGRYQLILSNTANDNVLLANQSYNITTEVINALNARYKK